MKDNLIKIVGILAVLVFGIYSVGSVASVSKSSIDGSTQTISRLVDNVESLSEKVSKSSDSLIDNKFGANRATSSISNPFDFSQGINLSSSGNIQVDGVEVVDASGNIDAPITSGSASTFASTVGITGDLTVDTSTLFVDASENKLALGSTTATTLLTVGSTTVGHITTAEQYRSIFNSGQLEVDGTSWFDGILNASSTALFTGAVTMYSTLDVSSGATTLATTTTGNLTHGVGVLSYTVDATLTEDQLLANSQLYGSATGAGQAVVALTLPATSTMTTLLATAGQCRTWHIDASDLAAATTTTITAGTGWDIVGLDATGAGSGADVIDGAEFGDLTACRQNDTDVIGYVTEWIAAD